MEAHIAFLRQQLDEYYRPFDDFRKGRNKKTRDAGARTSDNIRLVVQNYINRHEELHQEFIRFFPGFAYDEAFSWQYFHRDMPRFVDHLRNLE
ncbi:MAG: hypothetical protein HKN83_11260 [Gammaproteobacteria bacterium]|nr:hypothetical protein [Gammaproteobacteria bacterium]